MVGFVFGMRALRAIRRNPDRLTGNNLAKIGIALSICSFVGQNIGLNWFVGAYRTHLEDSAIQRVEQTFTDAEQAAADAWLSDSTITVDSISDFQQQATQRYGKFQHVSLTTQMVPNTTNTQTISVPLTFVFERDQRIGGAVFQMQMNIFPNLRLKRLVIDDPINGDVVLGVE